MLTIRKATDRGRTKIDWLDSWHTFSFGDYHDPAHMNFRNLRVINDDIVGPGGGFDTHPHRDMEIITVMLSGSLRHRDSLGSEGLLRPGEIQVMTAGRGIRHSEHNGSQTEPCHLLQIWIMPEARGLTPAYAQKPFPAAARKNQLCKIASRDAQSSAADGGGSGGGDASPMKINQDVDILLADLDPGAAITHTLRPGRGAWVHIATGSATINGQKLSAGDAAGIEGESKVQLQGAGPNTTAILFDCA